MLKHKYIWIITMLLAIAVAVGHYYGYASLWWLVWVILGGIAITLWGSFDLHLNYFIKAHHKSYQTQEKQVALTFNGGPHPITELILDLLKQHDMKATFFCIGNQVDKYPELIKRIDKEGHTIGNHTYTHSRNMWFLPTKKIKQELRLTDALIQRAIYKKPKLFRPPFSVTNPNIAKAVKEADKQVIGWNVRSMDNVYAKEYNIISRVLPKLKPGAIILFHDTSEKTARVLEQLLVYMKHKKYTSVTVNELLDIEAYHK